MNVLELSLAVRRKFRSTGLRGVMASVKTMVMPATSPFDTEFGTDTEAVVPLWRLKIDSANRRDGVRYQTMEVDAIRVALRLLPINLRNFTLIDLGSGKGRTLLIGSELPFKAVLGAEFSPELHAIARANIAKYPNKQCSNVTSLLQDATQYEFPPGDLVVYLYHPFDAPVLRKALDNLTGSLRATPREVYVVYFNPQLADVIEQYGFRKIDLPTPAAVFKWNQPIAMSEAHGKVSLVISGAGVRIEQHAGSRPVQLPLPLRR